MDDIGDVPLVIRFGRTHGFRVNGELLTGGHLLSDLNAIFLDYPANQRLPFGSVGHGLAILLVDNIGRRDRDCTIRVAHARDLMVATFIAEEDCQRIGANQLPLGLELNPLFIAPLRIVSDFIDIRIRERDSHGHGARNIIIATLILENQVPANKGGNILPINILVLTIIGRIDIHGLVKVQPEGRFLMLRVQRAAIQIQLNLIAFSGPGSVDDQVVGRHRRIEVKRFLALVVLAPAHEVIMLSRGRRRLRCSDRPLVLDRLCADRAVVNRVNKRHDKGFTLVVNIQVRVCVRRISDIARKVFRKAAPISHRMEAIELIINIKVPTCRSLC